MSKPVCCLALALCVAACGPPKAELVETAPAAPTRKPATKPTAATDPAAAEPAPAVAPNHGMRRPDLTGKLPDQRDMTATAPAAPGGGVIATPPTANKRDGE